ncbi:putative ABC transporter, integral membrane protein [Fructobacillus pseudoficulneus]|uniref:Putative ABC transporter, integral membrane protein n=1 Tax=Fructobacillus pseudoficulneus TaxID=220714 RepID=A0A3F3GTZ6_9LACO|nr:ABC transporter permease [Fructobacillus pseudoficulneus]GAP02865.1 putative ABC transporter, integral membrane protein [Fructobacillus pseudoficulneus]SEH45586.1 multidrug/hemolysin transport system permease protein [Fructobacillus pseudoficulneus]
MLALIKRNLLLYFRNRSGVVMSLMGAGISFLLFIIFLKKGISSDWTGISQKNQLLDTWLIGGTLAVTGITTTFASLSQLIHDRENHVLEDLQLTDVQPFTLQASYIVSAALIGFCMQVMMFVIMAAYFAVVDQMTFPWNQLGELVWLMVISAVLATLVNYLLVYRLNNSDTLGKLGTVIGTAVGFLVGNYIPVGSLPDFAQSLMKVTPGFYVASLYRQVLMDPTLKSVFSGQVTRLHSFDQEMGVRVQWSELLTKTQSYEFVLVLIIGLTLVVALLAKRQTSKNG